MEGFMTRGVPVHTKPSEMRWDRELCTVLSSLASLTVIKSSSHLLRWSATRLNRQLCRGTEGWTSNDLLTTKRENLMTDKTTNI